MDLLSALLTLHELRSRIDVRCQLQGDWLRPHAAGELNVIRWHGLLDGGAHIELATGQRHALQAGSLIMLPQSGAHRLCHDDGDVRLICGSLWIAPAQRHLLAALPDILIYHEPGAWLTATLQRLYQESAEEQAGSQLLCQQLSTVLLTLALRHWLAQAPTQGGAVAGLNAPTPRRRHRGDAAPTGAGMERRAPGRVKPSIARQLRSPVSRRHGQYTPVTAHPNPHGTWRRVTGTRISLVGRHR